MKFHRHKIWFPEKCVIFLMTSTSVFPNELHIPIIKNFPKRKVYVNGIDKIWAADLVEMQAFSKFNRGVIIFSQ